MLRLEEMDLWYDAFLRRYGLDEFVDELRAKGRTFYQPALTAATRVSQRACGAAWGGGC